MVEARVIASLLSAVFSKIVGLMNEMVPNQQNLIIYNTLDGKVSVTMMARDGNVWMNQKQMAELFATSKQNVGQHISNILKENELALDSVVKNFFITAADSKQYDVTFYSLDMVLAVGFRVKGKRGTQFRIWANQHLKEFIVKGFVLDDERLKNPDGRPDYFDELLERADIVSLHCPLTSTNQDMMGREQFKKMKKTAFFWSISHRLGRV